MLGQERKTNRVQIWIGITLITMLLGLALGMWLASTVLSPSHDSALETYISGNEDTVSQLVVEIQSLRSDMEDMDSASSIIAKELAETAQREDELEWQLSQAQATSSTVLDAIAEKELALKQVSLADSQIASLKSQLQSSQSQAQVNVEAIRDMSNTIERHRLLLVEIRKDPPETREETVAYWNNIRGIASRANPALSSPVEKVMLKIDNYFDWSDRSPNTTRSSDDYVAWLADYTTSGAIAYEAASATFTKDALLAVITHLDSVATKLN